MIIPECLLCFNIILLIQHSYQKKTNYFIFYFSIVEILIYRRNTKRKADKAIFESEKLMEKSPYEMAGLAPTNHRHHRHQNRPH